MIVVVTGPDHAMVRHAVRTRAAAADPDGQSTSEIDGTSATMSEVIQAIASVGFFSAGRCVIVNDFVTTQNKGARGRAGTDWSGLFGAVPAESTLILADPQLMSLPAAVKKALPADAEMVLGDPPRGPQLVRWIRDRAGALGSSITEPDARGLAERLYPQSWAKKSNNPVFDRPPDLALLGVELEKLAVAADPGPIRKEHIDRLVHRGDDDRIFGFIDAAMAGNTQRAVVELDRLIVAGDDPHRILAQLGQSIELAAILATAGGRDPVQAGREIGLSNPARMTSIARSMGAIGPVGAQRAVAALADADRRMKTGVIRDPVEVIHALLADIASARTFR